MNTQEKVVKERKIYLELLRVIALMFVMYNHSPAFMSFQTQTGVEYGVSLVLSMLCKCAVPVFFMISGTLLLGKDEPIGVIYKKRIPKIMLVLILFSFLYYMKLVLKGGMAFSLVSFVDSILREPIFLPYWYLYAYLAFLVILPLLRPIARHMTKELTLYLIVLQLIFGVVFEVLGESTGWWLSGYFDLDAFFNVMIFYPLVGYGIDHTLEDEFILSKRLLWVNLVLPVVAVGTGMLVYQDYLQYGVYREFYFGFSTSIVAILLFLDVKVLFKMHPMSERSAKIVNFIGDKVFGMYLLDGFLGTGGAMDVIFRVISPFVGFIPAYLIEILIIFGIRLAGVTILKKFPVLKTVL